MSRIEVLTPARECRIPEFVERWRAIGVSTAPTGRRAAEHAIRRCYERAGIKTPEKFIWLKSPMAGALAYVLLKYSNASVQDSIRPRIGVRIGDSVGNSVRRAVRDTIEDIFLRHRVNSCDRLYDSLWHHVNQVKQSIGETVRDSVEDSLWASSHREFPDLWGNVQEGLKDSVWASVEESLGASVRNSVWANVDRGTSFDWQIPGSIAWESVGESAVYGSHEAGWLCPYSYLLDVCGLKECERFDGLLEQAKHCGWWWPFENLVIATEKPVSLHLDDRGRLHHATEPAIAYGDGRGVYAWHGVRIPPQYYEQPVTAQQLLLERNIAGRFRNAEVRRALIERYGPDRFFLDAGAAVLDRDPEHGAELIAIDLPGDPERRMVALKLRCPSTSAVYIVRVPPRYRKARAALAWSYGLDQASDYVLAGES